MKTAGPRRKGLGAPAAALLVALLVVVAAFAYASLSSASSPIASSAGSSATRASTSYPASGTSSTSTSLSSAETSAALPAGCSPMQGDGYVPGAVYNLTVGFTSPATVCVQFYLFDPNATVTVSTTSLLVPPPCESAVVCQTEQAGVDRSLAGNFTVTASQDQLVLGGPANANEGTAVVFSLTAKPGVVGTHPLTLQTFMSTTQSGATFPSVQTAYLASAQGFNLCFPFFDLVVGSGLPNYAPGPQSTTGC